MNRPVKMQIHTENYSKIHNKYMSLHTVAYNT